MIQKILKNLFDFEREETVGEIFIYRFFELIIVYWTIKYAWHWGLYLSRLKDTVVSLGIAEYVDVTFMFNYPLGIINAVLMTVLVLVGFFRLWRYAYLATLLLFHLQYVARYSQGEISHGSNLVGLVLFAMAMATLAFEHRTEIRRAALGLTYFFLGCGYTSAALCKLVATGPTWSDGRHLWMWIQERTIDHFSLTGSVDYNALQELALDHQFIGTVFLTFGLLAEFFAFLFWFKRTRPLAGTLLAGMHIGIWGVMRLTFNANTYLLLILAYPWEWLIDWGLRRLGDVRFDKIRKLSVRWT